MIDSEQLKQHMVDEGEALVAGGGAIYLNMGTLFPIYEQTIPRAAKAAHDAGKPWVLDPVGLGIGSLRTQLVNELKQYKPAIVRGNASEIIALAGLWGLEFTAAVCGTAVYNVAGTRAAAVADAPASFKVAFIDELYRATAQDIADNRLELEEA